ncbi:retron Ec67 family RNA-directed DNA polymerase/endonuclease [Pseudomonas sp. Eth.TT006]
MSELIKLKKTNSLSDLALYLGYKPKSLSYILYKKPKEELYRSFEIPKKTGGSRTISAPCKELKLLQSKLLEKLQACINEIQSLKKLRKTLTQPFKTEKNTSLSHGFKPGYSIITNARQHRHKRHVLNIDLENFFGSIHFGRVRGFFIKNQDFNLHPKIATILAQIACHDNVLPQGSPCSPLISNLVAHVLDIRLAELAKKNDCTYSRYADDITFSTNEKNFPNSLAVCVCEEDHIWIAGKTLVDLVKKCWFSINHAKTRLQYKDSRQEVTGLIVNSKVNVRAEYHRTAKAMAHRLFHSGKYETLGFDKDGLSKKVPGSVNQLSGVFSFIYMVNKYNRNLRTINPLEKFPNLQPKLKSIEETHRKLLFYKDFYANEVPTIMCEGKTDNVYLRTAIRSLSEKFPALIEKDKDGEKRLKLKIFNYTDQVKYLMHLTGGTGDMVKFTSNYPKECSFYKSKGGLKPVILVVDNDQGASDLYTRIQKFGKMPVKPDGSKPFYFYSNNLYIVPTPLTPDGKQTMIENLFDPELLKTELDGKTFNPDEKTATASNYSKNHFAEYVVKANQKTIDFSGFEPLLATISKIIQDHERLSALATLPLATASHKVAEA